MRAAQPLHSAESSEASCSNETLHTCSTRDRVSSLDPSLECNGIAYSHSVVSTTLQNNVTLVLTQSTAVQQLNQDLLLR